jgi:hypothetical protein
MYHEDEMDREERNAYNIFIVKPEGNRPCRRPRHR